MGDSPLFFQPLAAFLSLDFTWARGMEALGCEDSGLREPFFRVSSSCSAQGPTLLPG